MNAAFTCRFLLALALLSGACLPVDRAAAQGTTTQRTCGKSAIYDASSSGSTRIVVGTGTAIYVCGYTFTSAVGAVSVGLVYGTGTNCGTNTTKITPAYPFGTITAITGIADGSPVFRGLVAPPGNDLCINTTTNAAVQAIVYYDNSSL
jgi:hypothetical protein